MRACCRTFAWHASRFGALQYRHCFEQNEVRRYAHVVYVSCSPSSLARDLAALAATHETLRFAVFDQFAGTRHLECGALLRRRDGATAPGQRSEPLGPRTEE